MHAVFKRGEHVVSMQYPMLDDVGGQHVMTILERAFIPHPKCFIISHTCMDEQKPSSLGDEDAILLLLFSSHDPEVDKQFHFT
jgi:hypothetical protein